MRNDQAVLVGQIPRTKDVLYKTIRIRLYSIGWMSFLTYVAKVTLRLWERKGIFPKPMFCLGAKTRWYTPFELQVYSKAIINHYQDRKNSTLRTLRVKLHDAQIQARKHYNELSAEDNVPTQVLPQETLISKNVKRVRLAKIVQRSTIAINEIEEDSN